MYFMSKQIFKVEAEVVSYCYIYVEAESADEAEAFAETVDGGDFITDDSPTSGDWNICGVHPNAQPKKGEHVYQIPKEGQT
jgi:hypothetical protein